MKRRLAPGYRVANLLVSLTAHPFGWAGRQNDRRFFFTARFFAAMAFFFRFTEGFS
jgi:hypothetical protein